MSEKKISKESSIAMLTTMCRIRAFESRAKSLYRRNLIFGALHLYIGQEAIAAGVCAALEKDDYVLSTHRGHGHCIAKGAEPKYMLAELMGKATGYSGGCGGSMHIFCKELGLMGGNGIVGGGIPISVGIGYSIFYRNSEQVVVCFFGDGAANQGTFHESLNMASLWKLPIIYVCENNAYAATTRVEDVTCVKHFAQRAAGYDMPGVTVDGNDVEEVCYAAAQAVEMARRGGGPSLIECQTYRIENHCMVINQPKPPEELNAWKQRDPIDCYVRKLIDKKVLTAVNFERIKSQIDKEIDEAEVYAMESPWPDVKNMFETLMV